MATTNNDPGAAIGQAAREAVQAAGFDSDAMLTRRAAAAFLRGRGFPVAEATLATKATRGGGPPYSLWSGRALYRAGDLLDWARASLSAPRLYRPRFVGHRVEGYAARAAG
jgi:hypothetical protein